MNETCDRCGPGTRAAYRVNQAGELYLCGHCTTPAMDGALRPGLDHLAAGPARPRAASRVATLAMTAPSTMRRSRSPRALSHSELEAI